MNAHKFVAEKGVDEAKRILKLAPENSNYRYYSVDIGNSNSGWHVDYRANCIDLVELKQVVESVEIVSLFGGIVNTRAVAAVEDTHYMGCKLESCHDLLKAIADYELVESYKQVTCEVLDVVDVSPRCEVRNG